MRPVVQPEQTGHREQQNMTTKDGNIIPLHMRKRCSTEEATNHFGPAPESSDTCADAVFEVALILGAVVAEWGTFEMLPDAFVRVEFIGIRRQRFCHQPRVFSEPVLNEPAAVDADVVPEDNDLARNVAQQRPQETHPLPTLDGPTDQVQVQPPTTGNTRDGRQLWPTKRVTDDT